MEPSSQVSTSSGQFSIGPITLGSQQTDSLTRTNLSSQDVGAYASMLAKRAAQYSSTTAIVIDEFDTIRDNIEKEKLNLAH